MQTLPPVPGTSSGFLPPVRGLVLGWLVLTVLGWLLLGANHISAAFGAELQSPNAPRWTSLLLTIPVAVAVVGYSFSIWRLWRRLQAVNMWLVGLVGAVTYFVADTLVSEGNGLIYPMSSDSLALLGVLLVPGWLIVMIDQEMSASPVLDCLPTI